MSEPVRAAGQAPLRILILSQHFWPESFRINDVALALQAQGCEVEVLTGQPNYPMGQVFPGYQPWQTGTAVELGLTIHRVPLAPRSRGGALRLVANYLSFVFSASLFGAWRLRGRRFDVIFVYGTSPILQALAGILLARLKGCALVTWVQDLWPQSLEVTGYVRNPKVLKAVARVVSWIYARCELLLVQSEAFTAPVQALSGRTPIRCHPNPGDMSGEKLAHAATAPAALQLQEGFNVVFAGNLGTAQALDSILDAAALLAGQPEIRIVLVGSGQRSAWLAEEVARRQLSNVQLAGRYEPGQMPPVLAQASALLVTLADDPAMRLTVPSKVQTYLGAGRPIIAALAGEGARIVADSGAGLACPPADGAALARTIAALHAMPEARRKEMGAAGLHYYDQHYCPSVLTPRLVEHLRAAADQHRAAATIRD